MKPFLKYLNHSEIDKEKWDACVNKAPNGLIYAESWYLDIMSPGWDALILEDYKIIMPLTKKRKMGIDYLAQPAFSQQLGIIGSINPEDEIEQKFMNKVLKKYSYAAINLNFLNKYPGCNFRSNYILDLRLPFDRLKINFKKDLLAGTKNAVLHLRSSKDYEVIINKFRENYGKKIPHLKARDFKNFSAVCNHLQKNSRLIIRSVDSENVKDVACALFFIDKRRIYYMMSVVSAAGRQFGANAFLLHEIIKEFSDSHFLFDFEGSSIPSIKKFFKKFNPEEQPFPFIRINHLPTLLKLFKK